jgi:hypothetical protein
MEQALESQYSWSKSDIIKNAYSSGRKYIDKIERKSNKYVSTLIDQFECNPLMVSSYACVLEIMILQIKSKDKLKAYEEYVKFMNNELFGSLAIENHLAMCYFLGEGNTENLVKAIFKFGKKPLLLNAWNTCWDIFFIRLLIKSHYDSSNDIIKPVLITADNGIRDLAKAMAIETAISSGEDFLPILSFSDTGIKTEYVKIANNLEKQLYFDTLLRMEKRNKIGDLNTHLIKIISELERELIYIS